MIQLTEDRREVSEAGLALIRRRLFARVIRPADGGKAWSGPGDSQPFTTLLFCLSIVLSILLIGLSAGPPPTPAAGPGSPERDERFRRDGIAIIVPSLGSLIGSAATLAEKKLSPLGPAFPGKKLFARARQRQNPGMEAAR